MKSKGVRRARRHGAGDLVLAVVMVLAACGGTLPEPQPEHLATPAPTPSPAPSPAPFVAGFNLGPCRFKLPDGEAVECGDLVVPEDRSRAGSRTIRLHVAIIRSHIPNPAPDPVIYLSEGPGVSVLADIAGYADLFAGVLAKRDLILFDQRGVGYSEPALHCPEWDQAVAGKWATSLGPEAAIAREVQQHAACRDRLVQEGINLAAYHSAAGAADVNDLRQALGYDQVNLLGRSYGARLALLVMRDFPEGIRSAVLDSALPVQADFAGDLHTNAQRSFDVLFQSCEAHARCRAAFPDLEVNFYQLVDRLNAEPVTLQARDAVSGELRSYVLDGDRLVDILLQLLQDWNRIPWLPKTLDEMARGNYVGHFSRVLRELVTARDPAGSEALRALMMCGEEASFSSPEGLVAGGPGLDPRVAAYFESTATRWLSLCKVWGAYAPPAVDNEPVTSDLPVLILAGEHDPLTPPAYGQMAAGTLSRSAYYEFPGVGHGVLGARPCADELLVSFLEAPERTPDARCMAGLRTGFFTY